MRKIERVVTVFFIVCFVVMLAVANYQQGTIEKYDALVSKQQEDYDELADHFLSQQSENFWLNQEVMSLQSENAQLYEDYLLLSEEYYDYQQGHIVQFPVYEFTYDEVVKIAKTAQCETGTPVQSPDAFRYLVATILNRVASPEYPDTVDEVLHQKNQWSVVQNGTIDTCTLTSESLAVTLEVIMFGTDLPPYVVFAFEDNVESEWLLSLPVYVSVNGTTFAYAERS